LSYNWSQTAGSAVTLSDAHASSPSFTALSVDADTPLTFEVVVNDGQVDSTPSDVTITININDNAPVADAGSDVIARSLHHVTLHGSGSSDLDGDALTYNWSQTAGPAVTLSDAHAVNPTFVAPNVTEDTTLTFSLVVNDGLHDSAPDSVD